MRVSFIFRSTKIIPSIMQTMPEEITVILIGVLTFLLLLAYSHIIHRGYRSLHEVIGKLLFLTGKLEQRIKTLEDEKSKKTPTT